MDDLRKLGRFGLRIPDPGKVTKQPTLSEMEEQLRSVVEEFISRDRPELLSQLRRNKAGH